MAAQADDRDRRALHLRRARRARRQARARRGAPRVARGASSSSALVQASSRRTSERLRDALGAPRRAGRRERARRGRAPRRLRAARRRRLARARRSRTGAIRSSSASRPPAASCRTTSMLDASPSAPATRAPLDRHRARTWRASRRSCARSRSPSILAQMGSFVPARRARIGVVDRVLTRVGASDNLARGESTFMVEMHETANILRRATRRSLVVLDEIGRGTSTYDGLSIAWAVAEHLHDVVGCRALFATHYHELTELAASAPRAANYSVSAREHAATSCSSTRCSAAPRRAATASRARGSPALPEPVLARARAILAALERGAALPAGGEAARAEARAAARSLRRGGSAEGARRCRRAPRSTMLRALDVDRITPLEALTTLAKLKGPRRSDDDVEAERAHSATRSSRSPRARGGRGRSSSRQRADAAGAPVRDRHASCSRSRACRSCCAIASASRATRAQWLGVGVARHRRRAATSCSSSRRTSERPSRSPCSRTTSRRSSSRSRRPLVLGERATRAHARGRRASRSSGSCCLLEPWRSSARANDLVGAALGAGSAVFYASNVLVNKRLARAFSGERADVLPRPRRDAAPLRARALASVRGASRPRARASSSSARSARGRSAASSSSGACAAVPASHASVLTLLEPFVAVVLAAAVLGERLGRGSIRGRGLILAGAVVVVTGRARRTRRGDGVDSEP